MTKNILIERDLAVTTGDGTRLFADVHRPADDRRRPAILQRTPYGKSAQAIINGWIDVQDAVDGGFAVVVQDVRGRGKSGGTFKPFRNEAADGKDTIDWVSRQPWCSGDVFMCGGSYVGATQLLAATHSPKALRAIAPASTPDAYREGWAYRGGAFELGFVLCWCYLTLALGELGRLKASDGVAELQQQLMAGIDDPTRVFEHTPVRDLGPLDDVLPFVGQWLDSPGESEAWRSVAPSSAFDRVMVPAFHIGGWHDIFLRGTLANYMGVRNRAGSPQVRSNQRLLIGPWSHGYTTGWFPERQFGAAASAVGVGLGGRQLRWFDDVLHGREGPERPVTIFVMGPNVWRDELDWPLPDTSYVPYYLRAQGATSGADHDGQLLLSPVSEQSADAYDYDPSDPVPTVGGPTFLPGLFVAANAGPREQREVEERADVLCYSTEPLAGDLEVTGPVTLKLYVSSTAPDTDVCATLSDVDNRGHSQNVCEGIRRLRWRGSNSEPQAARARHDLGEIVRLILQRRLTRVPAWASPPAARDEFQLPTLRQKRQSRGFSQFGGG